MVNSVSTVPTRANPLEGITKVKQYEKVSQTQANGQIQKDEKLTEANRIQSAQESGSKVGTKISTYA